MAHTYCTNLVHCVFSTKERAELIAQGVQEHLYAYLLGIAKNLGFQILALGGTANHVHILLGSRQNTACRLCCAISRQTPRDGCEKAIQNSHGRRGLVPSASAIANTNR
ncbi:MAG: hypothetical protein DMG77_16535 [Acidobacteria bacterium]|nr:MAG: hypothetical protein DMG77_16535 [Acidobacteriota bacterium]